MFKIAKKQASRVGSQQVKVLFQVEIRNVCLPKAKEIGNGTEISLCFERGGKMATSKDISLIEYPGGDLRAEPNETLTLVATLYRIADGSFQPKQGRVVVRQKKRSRIGVDSYRGLGEVPLALDILAGDLQTQHSTSPLQRSSLEGASITLAITARYINDAPQQMGETMSVVSGFSEASAGAADFNASPPQSVADEDEFDNAMPRISTIYESSDVERDTLVRLSCAVKEELTRYIPPTILEEETEEAPSTQSNAAFVALEARYNQLAANYLIRSQENEVMTQQLSKITQNYTQLYQQNISKENELQELRAQWSELEATQGGLALELQQMKAKTAASEAKALELQKELELANRFLSKERAKAAASEGMATSAAVMTAHQTSELHSELAAAKEHIAAMEVDALETKDAIHHMQELHAGELQKRDAAIADLQSTVEKLREEAISTASEIHSNDVLLQDLITAKVLYANLAFEFDQEIKKGFMMKRRLQGYAEKVASLEVLVAGSGVNPVI